MTPVIPVGPLLQGADESFLRAAQLGERWALLFVLPSECVTSCVEQIQLMQQMQIALGKYQDQLLKFVVVTASSFTTALKDIEIDSLAILTMRAPDGLVSDRLYLVDPFGNIVMAYHSSEDGMKILKDIRHLIKLSTTSR
jgi:cytochrome oxidase Cu insertion factor (SCO1/SenC/PrrC family)